MRRHGRPSSCLTRRTFHGVSEATGRGWWSNRHFFIARSPMNELAGGLGAAAEVEAICRAEGWQFCFIGAVAVQRWGAPRFTKDVDLTVYTGWGSEEHFVDVL